MPVKAAFDYENVVADEQDCGGENADYRDGEDGETGVGGMQGCPVWGAVGWGERF